MKPEHKRYILSCALIIILGFAVYSNSLDGEFIWDDNSLIRENVYIKRNIGSNITQIFAQSIGAGAGKDFSFYRPLQILTYMLDYSLWDLNVWGYHFTNVILHILVALSIFWLVNLFYDNWLLSLCTGLFFVAHPVHTEAVAYISGRADSLAAFFILLCFIFYIKSLHSKRPILFIPMLASYALALLSRENALILPGLILLYHYSLQKRLKTREFLSLSVLSLLYITFRFTLLKSLLSNITYTTTILQRLPGFFVAIANYIRVLLLPFNLHMEYGNNLFNFTHPQAILGIAILVSLCTYTLKQKRTRPLIFFSISWFLIALLPQANLYPINAYMAEHWLYLPSIGFFLIVAGTLNYLYTNKHLKSLSIILFLCLVSFYSFLTISQNNYWKDPMTFNQRTLKYAPDSVRALNGLGLAYHNLNRSKEAIPLLKKAIEINPQDVKSYNNLANAYHALGRDEDAIPLLKKAVQIRPDFADAYNNLGNVYRDRNKEIEAITAFKKAIESNPNYVIAYYNLGNLYYDLGRSAEAISMLEKAIRLNPGYVKAYNNLANLYYETGRKEEAIPLYKKAIQINPDYAEAYNNLAIAYYLQKQYNLAIEYYEKAKKLGYLNQDLLNALKPYMK